MTQERTSNKDLINYQVPQDKNKSYKINNCPFCNKLQKKNFSRHIERNHKDTPEGIALLKITSEIKDPVVSASMKKKITNSLRNIGNDIHNTNVINQGLDNEVIPVNRRASVKVKCVHCLGLYGRRKLSVHLKHCSKAPLQGQVKSPLKSLIQKKCQAIREHSLPLVREGASDSLLKNVLPNMRQDEITKTVMNDELILKMGSQFLMGMGHRTERNVVSQKMRDMGILLIKLKKLNLNIKSLSEALDPKYFNFMIEAVKELAKVDKAGGIGVVGMAYRISQCINKCLKILLTAKTSEAHLTNNSNRDEIRKVKDFMEMIKNNWVDVIGKQSTKSLKYKKSLKTPKMAQEKDILTVSQYIEGKYDIAIKHLKKNARDERVYNLLVDMVVSHIMLLIRRRPVDIERAEVEHYTMMDIHDGYLDMVKEANDKTLSDDDLNAITNFHIFYPVGKKFDLVPIVLTKKMKQVTDLLILLRPEVGITWNVLFSYTRNRSINPAKCLERMKENIGIDKLVKPKDLCATGLRHHAATFSKLHSDNPHYQEHLAAVLGHTLFIHKKNYDLPTSVSHKAIVMPVLHSMTTKQNFKNAGEKINPQENKSSNNDNTIDIDISEYNNDLGNETNINSKRKLDVDDSDSDNIPLKVKGKKISRLRWSEEEKKIIYLEFGTEILGNKHIDPKQVRCLKENYQEELKNRSIEKIFTFIDNAKKRKFNASPDVKKILNKYTK